MVTPTAKESSPTLLDSLLDLLPDNAFSKKPLLLFATGGLPGHVAILGRAFKQILFRLGATTIAARVHIGTGSWILVGDDHPRLSRGVEREVSYAIDLVLRAVQSGRSFSRTWSSLASRFRDRFDDLRAIDEIGRAWLTRYCWTMRLQQRPAERF
jgi:NAD(P)H-dependent FMN reductase